MAVQIFHRRRSGDGRRACVLGDQLFLPRGSPEEVRAEVRRYIRALAPGGGYIVAPAHNVQSDVPPANLVALRDAVEAYGHYPII